MVLGSSFVFQSMASNQAFSPSTKKKKKKKGSLNVITSKGKMPLSANCLRSARVNQLWGGIN